MANAADIVGWGVTGLALGAVYLLLAARTVDALVGERSRRASCFCAWRSRPASSRWPRRAAPRNWTPFSSAFSARNILLAWTGRRGHGC